MHQWEFDNLEGQIKRIGFALETERNELGGGSMTVPEWGLIFNLNGHIAPNVTNDTTKQKLGIVIGTFK